MTIATDRWLEMDLTWFDPTDPFEPQIETVMARVAPLLAGVDGDRGIFFNLGWLIDLVTEWTGDPAQHLPTRSRRTADWATRTYADLGRFVARFRDTAARHGVPDLQVGILFVGWAHVVWPPELKIYDFESDWYDRHPELYGEPHTIIGMPELLPVNRLEADEYPYATAPTGLAEGTYFPDFFGAQWGDLSRAIDLDAVHLRDGMTGPMVYTRNGPFGTRAPADPEIVAAFSQAVRDLYAAVKTGNPEALVFGYSSAISPVADWRVGCVDVEALVADGYVDAWVEQTWGGAWQDWWHQLWKGWTFQLGNLLTRGAMIARANEQRDRPCKLYNLIETWDGWEPWDTIHQVPHKLRWATWAFSHAATLTPDGPTVPDGSYVSWINNGDMELLSDADVRYVAENLNAAQASAAELEDVYGPAIVYNRNVMEWLSETHPDWNVSEWVDDQTAMLMKWGVPALSSTRSTWLADTQPEVLIAQTPGHLPERERQTLLANPQPVLVTGRADVLDAEIRERLGIALAGDLVEGDFYVARGEHPETPGADRPYVPTHQPIETDDDVDTYYQTEETALLTGRDGWLYWQPLDWSEPFNQFVPKYQLGSTFPHFYVASLLHEAAEDAGLSHVANLSWPKPVSLSLWRSAGHVHLLLGNLETGVFGDARTPRTVVCRLSRSQLDLPEASYRLERVDAAPKTTLLPIERDDTWLTYRIELPPEQAAVYRLVAASE